MDIIAHIIWTYLIFHKLKLDYIFLAVFFGILPDLMSFGLYLPYLIFKGKFRLNKLKRIEKEHKKTPKWVEHLYNFSHSLFIPFSFFILISLLMGKISWFVLPWIIHILIDIPLHTKHYYPTPFLWPFSKYKFYGIKWHNMKFMIVNYTLLFIICILTYLGVF
jgi:hypothetical protein